MGLKLAMDFGTTNSIVARRDERTGAAEIVSLPGLSLPANGLPALVPSLLYVQDGQSGEVTAGQAVLDGGCDRQRNHRLRVTVTDLKTRRTVLRDAVLATLGESAPPPATPLKTLFAVDETRSLDEQLAQARAEMTRLWMQAAIRATSGQGDGAAPDSPPDVPILSGQEPRLAVGREGRGGRRLSPRGLATMLNVLPPEAISLDAAAAMLRSDEFYVRYRAATLLSQRGDRAARRVMQQALETGEPPTRASAARRLYGFSWFAAEPLLRRALADPDLRVREAAMYALCDLRESAAYRLAAAVLQDEADEVRSAAAFELRDCQDPQAVPVLTAALRADDPDVRVLALEALGANNTPDAVPVVRSAIRDDPDFDVKYAATLSLLELMGDACLAELADLIRETTGDPRRAILRGLFQATNYLKIDVAGSGAVEALLDALVVALDDPLSAARSAAVWPLAWLRHDRAPGLLESAYGREQDVNTKAEIMRVTVALMSPAGEALFQDALDSPDETLRETAERILVQRGAQRQRA